MAQAGLMAVAVILAGSGVAWAGEVEDDRRPVAIRVYNTAISSEDLSMAIGEATSAFQAAGLELSWTDCSAGRSHEVAGAAGCHRPVGSELVLRLHRRAGGDAASDTRAAAGFASMGYSLVHVERPSFASVYVDVVRAVARDAGADALALLGRAMAHEIGHLLLNSDRHADEGLMRAGWSRVELRRRDDDRAWRFSADEAMVMHEALAARVRPAD